MHPVVAFRRRIAFSNTPIKPRAVNDSATSARCVTFAVPAREFAKACADAARRVCGFGQMVAEGLSGQTAECHWFMNHGMGRNGDAVLRIAGNANLPPMCAARSEWREVAGEDSMQRPVCCRR